nr:NB-ARC domain-containing protein [Caldilineaceae bacterium]
MGYYPAFAQLLNQYLQARERTPAWLAKRLHLHPATVSRWLSQSTRPGDPATIGQIADLLCLHTTAERQAFLVAAGYGYQEAAPPSQATSSQLPAEIPPGEKSEQASAGSTHIDWGEAPAVSRFHGRQAELDVLRQWLVDDHCRLVAVLGMGGIGKTVLATLAATLVEKKFDYLIWRSLRNAPPLAELLGECIRVLANHGAQELPADMEQRITLLVEHLRRQRCLLVLDNFETVLQGERAGHYLAGYEGYGRLLQQVGEGRHHSCLVLTSREKPKELALLAGEDAPVRTLSLASLSPTDGRALLHDRGLAGSDQEWAALHERYSGNPLALQIVAETIRELFAGDIAQFLRHELILFGGISDLLAHQFERLSPLEQETMFWLAVEREPLELENLRSDFVQPPTQVVILALLHSLRQRSLVERTLAGFTLQNVVLEYL